MQTTQWKRLLNGSISTLGSASPYVLEIQNDRWFKKVKKWKIWDKVPFWMAPQKWSTADLLHVFCSEKSGTGRHSTFCIIESYSLSETLDVRSFTDEDDKINFCSYAKNPILLYITSLISNCSLFRNNINSFPAVPSDMIARCHRLQLVVVSCLYFLGQI